VKWSAEVPGDDGGVSRVAIVEGGSGVFLYLYDRRRQMSCAGEEWYETSSAARAVCRGRFGIADEDLVSSD